MNTKKLLFLLLSVLIISSMGCKKDNVSDSPNQDLELQETDYPGIMMTLAAISYASDGFTETTIRNDIVQLLKEKELGTKGNWKLVWGPGISPDSANMAFVAKADTDPVSFALVLRGTNPHSPDGVLQDLDAFKLVRYPGGETNDSISHGAELGMSNILNTADARTNRSLEWFLDSIPSEPKTTIFVTGHSQGGYLAPIMAYWVMNNQSFNNKFIVRTYTYAGPTVWNYGFTKNFKTSLSQNGGSLNMYVNKLDVIPYFWYNLPAIKENHIPVTVPGDIYFGYNLSDSTLKHKKIKYCSLADTISIGSIAIDTTEHPQTSVDSNAWYKKWMAVEHNHNNYLLLLGENPVPF